MPQTAIPSVVHTFFAQKPACLALGTEPKMGYNLGHQCSHEPGRFWFPRAPYFDKEEVTIPKFKGKSWSALGILLLAVVSVTILLAGTWQESASAAEQGSISPSSPDAVDKYVVLAWNDLGMYCYNRDFNDLAVLPPFNTPWAQVIRVGDPPEQNHTWTEHQNAVRPVRLRADNLDHPGVHHPYPFGAFSVLKVRIEEIDNVGSRIAAANPRI